MLLIHRNRQEGASGLTCCTVYSVAVLKCWQRAHEAQLYHLKNPVNRQGLLEVAGVNHSGECPTAEVAVAGGDEKRRRRGDRTKRVHSLIYLVCALLLRQDFTASRKKFNPRETPRCTFGQPPANRPSHPPTHRQLCTLDDPLGFSEYDNRRSCLGIYT